MGFKARVILPENRPPGRAYIHYLGMNEVYGSVKSAYNYLFFALSKHDKLLTFDFFLANVWGDIKEDKKVIDFFGYKDIKVWGNSNPSAIPFQVVNGDYFPDGIITCEDTLIAFGREGEFRRKTNNLDEFMRNYPSDIGGLEKGIITIYPRK